MNVEDAIRKIRSSLPETPDGLAQRIVASATSGGAAPSRRSRRLNTRGLLVAASVVAAAALLITVGILLRDGDRPDPEPATPVIPPARVDWGQIVTVRLQPDEGISIEEMRERFATALAFRTYDYGGAGVEVVSATGDEVQVRLPGAATSNQVNAYMRFDRLVILDNDSSIIAAGSNLEALRDHVERADLRSGAQYYVQSRTSSGEWAGLTRFDTLAQAETEHARLARSTATVMLAVPASLAVVGGDGGEDVLLIRPTQVVPASAVRSVRQDGGSIVVSLDERAHDEIVRKVRVFLDLSGDGTYSGSAPMVGTGTVTSAGDLRFSADSVVPASIARPDLGGRVSVVHAEPYGQEPVERTDDLPAGREIRSPGVRDALPKGTRWVRLATGRFDGVDYELDGAASQGAIVALYVTRVSGPQNEGSLITAEPGESGHSACLAGIGTPDVTYCSGSSGADGPTNGTYRYTSIAYGRVRPGVTRIRARLADIERDAVIDNGWWFVRISADVPQPSLLVPIGEASPVSLTAWDAEGNRLQVSPPRDIRK